MSLKLAFHLLCQSNWFLLHFAHWPISIVSIFIGDFLRYYKSSDAVLCTSYYLSAIVLSEEEKVKKILFFKEKLRYEYWNNRNWLMSLKLAFHLLCQSNWFLLHFAHWPISIVSIFIGDFLRYYKSSDAVLCTSY